MTVSFAQRANAPTVAKMAAETAVTALALLAAAACSAVHSFTVRDVTETLDEVEGLRMAAT